MKKMINIITLVLFIGMMTVGISMMIHQCGHVHTEACDH